VKKCKEGKYLTASFTVSELDVPRTKQQQLHGVNVFRTDKSHVVKGFIAFYGIDFKEGANESFPEPHEYNPISDTYLLEGFF
jgi:hypothetical protein